MSENYIQYLGGYNKDNIDLTDIDKAINEIQNVNSRTSAIKKSFPEALGRKRYSRNITYITKFIL